MHMRKSILKGKRFCLIELSDYDNYIYKKMIDELGGIEISDICDEFDYYLVDYYCKDDIVEMLNDKPCISSIYIQYCYYFNYSINNEYFLKGSKSKISKRKIYTLEIENIKNHFTFNKEKVSKMFNIMYDDE